MDYARFNRADLVAACGWSRCWSRCWWVARLCCLLVCCACAHAPLHEAPSITDADREGPDGTLTTTVRFVSPYTYEWFIRAELFAAQGDLVRAADAYRQALAGADEDPLVIARLALTLDALGETAEAQAQLRHGDTLDPESEAIWLARGEIAERHQDREQAIAAYQRAQVYAPHSATPTLSLARVLRDAPERALAVLQAFRAHNERWQPERMRIELSIALLERDLERANEAWHALHTLALARAADAEAVARLAMNQARPWLAREVLGSATDRILDRSLWLRVLIAVGDVSAARDILARSTADELGGLDAMAGFYLALGDHTHAAELATLRLAQGANEAATLTLLRANHLNALAAEVEHLIAPRNAASTR